MLIVAPTTSSVLLRAINGRQSDRLNQSSTHSTGLVSEMDSQRGTGILVALIIWMSIQIDPIVSTATPTGTNTTVRIAAANHHQPQRMIARPTAVWVARHESGVEFSALWPPMLGWTRPAIIARPSHKNPRPQPARISAKMIAATTSLPIVLNQSR